jgi:protein-S-isoprenylcysteine O-methyltransferase Ste14
MMGNISATSEEWADLSWAERLSLEARENTWSALGQILIGILVLAIVISLDHPFMFGHLERLAQQGSTQPNLNWLWVAKWAFALGAGIYVFAAFTLFCISIKHIHEAHLLVIKDGDDNG